MTLNIESDLKEIADKSFLDQLDQKLDKLQGDMSGLSQQDIPNISVKLENLTTSILTLVIRAIPIS
ncbi:MAG: hypothetical protein QNJ72_22910 [Pleurocapsa sp. MO_226.B13]|nr:hypothetical protein [Pleurocapsa sp. MO_226.B13]